MIRRTLVSLISALALVAGSSALPQAARALPPTTSTTWVVALDDEIANYEVGSQCADPNYWAGDAGGGGGDWQNARDTGPYDSEEDAIQDAIDGAASGDTIYVCFGNYNFDNEIGDITAGADLTIVGDGSDLTVFDGGDSTRLINANSSGGDDGGTLTLRDLAIVDAWVGAFVNGGAINSESINLSGVTVSGSGGGSQNGGALYAVGDIIIEDSTFSDNYTTQGGGAIYSWNHYRSVTIANSKFTGNGAGYSSGAILSAGDLSITSSEFLDNYSSSRPGGVLAGNNLSVVDSLFERNSTEVESAGAIVATGIGASVSITGSEFIDNTAFDHGGALVMERLDELKIMDTLFEGNVSERKFGGAINIYDVDRVSVVSSTFVSNEARGGDYFHTGNGGAIDACNVASFTSINSRYIDNVSTENGGAIGLFGITCASPGTITMTRNIFSGNSARSAGGALWLSGTLASMIGNRFLGNESGSLGGAVYGGWSEGAELVTRVVQRNTFTGNRAAEGGGAIWLPGQIDVLTRNTFARNWSGGDGGAITVSGLQGRGWHAIKGNRITRNTAEGRGGAFSLQCSSFSRSAQRRLVAANSLNGNIAASDRRSSGIYLASLC